MNSTARPYADSANPGANRLLESLRRLFLLGGVLTATGMLLYPADALLRVRAVDISAIPVERLVPGEKADRLQEVGGPAWTKFHEAVSQTLTGRSAVLARHLGRGIATDFLYFRPDDKPLAALAGRTSDREPLLHAVVRDGAAAKYLEILFQRPADSYGAAPAWLFYPFRPSAVWWFVGGLLAYALLPWHRKGPAELCYSRASQTVAPDFLGTTGAAAFFALSIVVVTANAASAGPVRLLDFTHGWGILTIVLWVFGAGFLSITILSLWYATLSLVLLPDRIRRRTFGGVADFPYSQMTGIEPAELDWPRWLRIAAWLMTVFGPGMRTRLRVGGLVLARRPAHGVAIHCRDGRTLKIWIDSLPGFDRIFRALRQASVPMDAELGRIADEDLARAAAHPATESPGAGMGVLAGVLFAAAIGGALALHFWPERPVKVERRLQYSDEALAQRRALLKQMEEVAGRMQPLGEQIKGMTAAPGTVTSQGQAAVMSRFESLMRQYSDLRDRYDAIQPVKDD